VSYLRAPYYRRTQNRTDTITVPGEFESASVIEIVPPPLAEVGTLVTYYNDKTPSNLTLNQDREINYSTASEDGIVGVRWTDRTADQYYTRILRKSGNTWFVQGQVAPGVSNYSISGFTVVFTSVYIGVQSLSTAENFISQYTYDTVFISGSIP